jgi:hypothetical protein
MTGHDHSAPDDNDGIEDVEAVEQHKIRYNPSSTTARTNETERIRYNPSRTTDGG